MCVITKSSNPLYIGCRAKRYTPPVRNRACSLGKGIAVSPRHGRLRWSQRHHVHCQIAVGELGLGSFAETVDRCHGTTASSRVMGAKRCYITSLHVPGQVVHTKMSRSARESQVAEILHAVGLRAESAHRYPHEFSGGQRQRIGIARALILRPKLIVADEPVSALDVSIQSQVLNLLVQLKREFALTYVFVAHDLAVVDYIADRVAVMYLGKIVELGTARDIRLFPMHPYTKALLRAIPQIEPSHDRGNRVLSGEVPSAIDPPSGCRFATRCPLVQDICRQQEPALEVKASGHQAACHFADLAVGEA